MYEVVLSLPLGRDTKAWAVAQRLYDQFRVNPTIAEVERPNSVSYRDAG